STKGGGRQLQRLLLALAVRPGVIAAASSRAALGSSKRAPSDLRQGVPASISSEVAPSRWPTLMPRGLLRRPRRDGKGADDAVVASDQMAQVDARLFSACRRDRGIAAAATSSCVTAARNASAA